MNAGHPRGGDRLSGQEKGAPLAAGAQNARYESERCRYFLRNPEKAM